MYNFVNQHCVILAHNSILYCSIRYCACHNELINVLVIIGKYIVHKTIMSNVFFVVLNIICYLHIHTQSYILILSLIVSIAFTSHICSLFCFNPYAIKCVHLFSYVCSPIRATYAYSIRAYRHIRDYNIIINKILFIIKIRKGNMKYSPILEPY